MASEKLPGLPKEKVSTFIQHVLLIQKYIYFSLVGSEKVDFRYLIVSTE